MAGRRSAVLVVILFLICHVWTIPAAAAPQETGSNMTVQKNPLAAGQLGEPVRKADRPKITKEVGCYAEETDSFYGGKAAAFGSGEWIWFRLTGTVSSDYESRETYYYCFRDFFGKAFCRVQDFRIYLESADGIRKKDLTKAAQVTVHSGNGSFSVRFRDLKKAAGKVDADDRVVVIYKTRLSDQAAAGGTGNPNEAYIEYSCPEEENGIGKTRKAVAKVFTFHVELVKCNAAGQRLQGALFCVESLQTSCLQAAQDEAAKAVGKDPGKGAFPQQTCSTDSSGSVLIKALPCGSFRFTEVRAPEGYEALPPFTLCIRADLSDPDIPVLTATCRGQGQKGGSVEITETDARKGVVKILVTDPETGRSVPKTGDTGRLFFHIPALLASGCVAAVLLPLCRRRRSG